LLVLLGLSVPGVVAADRLVSATLVLFNKNDPESAGLARYYASARAIPSKQVIGFDVPQTEEITREDFNRLIANPLRDKLVQNGWWTLREQPGGEMVVSSCSIRFLAIIRGFPLKISKDPSIEPATPQEGVPAVLSGQNEASVDSELAAMGLPDFTTGGVFPNPYFGRFTPILDEAISPGLMLPSRLDAPTAAMVPSPVKYRIYFGEPMLFEGDPNDDEAVIAPKVAAVKASIQTMIDRGLRERRGYFV